MVLTYFQLWNTGDPALADGLLGDHFVNHADPSVSDADSLKSAVSRMRDSDPQLRVFVDAVLGGPRMVTAVRAPWLPYRPPMPGQISPTRRAVSIADAREFTPSRR